MSLDRSTLFEGPATVTMGGVVFYSKDNVTVEVYRDTNPIKSAAFGKVDERVADIGAKITFTPVGQWTTAALAVLYPHTNPVPGTSMLTATDVPVTIWPLNGKEKIVFAAGCITKMPNLNLSASADTAFGPVEIYCGLANSTDRSGTAALYTPTATAAFSDTSFAVSEILTPIYTLALASASSPWDSFVTEGVVKVEFNLQSRQRKVDSLGTFDVRLVGLDITVKFAPANMTVAQVLAKMPVQGAGVAIGTSLSTGAANLTIAGSGSGVPTVTINKVALKRAPQQYGNDSSRHGELEFVATRPTGATMFSVGVTA